MLRRPPSYSAATSRGVRVQPLKNLLEGEPGIAGRRRLPRGWEEKHVQPEGSAACLCEVCGALREPWLC